MANRRNSPSADRENGFASGWPPRRASISFLFLFLGAVAFLGTTAGRAQTSPSQSSEFLSSEAPHSIPFELQQALDISAGISAEVAAQTLLRASNHRDIAGPEFRQIRREWIERAFHLAIQARFPYRLEATDPQSSAMRSVEGMQAMALSQDLDTLSLQAKAVESLLRFQPSDAARMFSRIPFPRGDVPSCTEFLLPETSIYFRTLGNLLRQRARLPEKEAGMLRMTVRDAVSATDTVSELVGLIPLIASPYWSSTERRDLNELAAAAITRIPGSDRTPWRHYETVQRAILATTLEGPGALLREAWAGLLDRQARAASGCDEERSEEQRRADRVRLGLMKDAITDGMLVPGGANTSRNSWVVSPSTANPTDGYAVQPLFVDETPRDLFLSSPSLSANMRTAALPVQPGGPPSPTDSARLTEELREETASDVARFLERLQAFRTKADIHSEVRFHEICQLWLLAIQTAPARKQQLEELQTFSNYLAETPMKRIDPPSWIRYSQRVLAHWNSAIGTAARSGEAIPYAPPATLSVLNAIPIAATMPTRATIAPKTEGPEQSPAH